MSSARETLVTALEKTGCEVFLQGSTTGKLPEKFITYLQVDATDISHYDNKPKTTRYRFQVDFYSTKMSDIITATDQITAQLQPLGFTRQGKGDDLQFENYYGLRNEFYYLESEE
jgi:hypothetical protein